MMRQSLTEDSLKSLKEQADESNDNGRADHAIFLKYEFGIGDAGDPPCGAEVEPFEKNIELAMEHLHKAAAKNCALAVFDLGTKYSRGIGVAKNDDQAREHWRRAVRMWEKDARVTWLSDQKEEDEKRAEVVGKLVWTKEPVAQIGAVEWIESDLNESTDALLHLGGKYYHGFGVEQNKTLACFFWRTAADLGHPEASITMGWLYGTGGFVDESGKTLPQDYDKAKELFERAKSNGCRYAYKHLALAYYYGRGVQEDKRNAIDLLLEGAKLGDQAAMRALGLRYFHGDGADKDYDRARMWLKNAGNLGDADAQHLLGQALLYRDTETAGALDEDKARPWLVRAADNELPHSSYYLAFFEIQQSCPDLEYAADMLRKAAGRKHFESILLLAVMTKYGLGCPRDEKAAKAWFDVVANHYNTIEHLRQKLGRFSESISQVRRLQIAAWLVELNRRAMWAIEWINRCDDPETVDTYSHYSGMELMRAILPSRGMPSGKTYSQLRLGSILRLNDPSEGQELVRFSVENSKEFSLHEFFPSSPAPEQSSDRFHDRVYCLSLCQEQDSLNLWRLYADDGRGVSVELPKSLFRLFRFRDDYTYAHFGPTDRSASTHSFQLTPPVSLKERAKMLYKVRYAKEDKRRMLHALEIPLRELLTLRETLENENDQRQLNDCVHIALLDILFLFKSDQYAPEHEYRLLVLRDPESPEVMRDPPDETGRCRFYLEMGPKVFPVIERNVGQEKTEKYRIWIGPSADSPREKKMEIEERLRNLGWADNVEVKFSAATGRYR